MKYYWSDLNANRLIILQIIQLEASVSIQIYRFYIKRMIVSISSKKTILDLKIKKIKLLVALSNFEQFFSASRNNNFLDKQKSHTCKAD